MNKTPVTKQGNAQGKHHQTTTDGAPEAYLKYLGLYTNVQYNCQ